MNISITVGAERAFAWGGVENGDPKGVRVSKKEKPWCTQTATKEEKSGGGWRNVGHARRQGGGVP